MYTVVDGKLAFTRDQIVTGEQVSADFDSARHRAKVGPLFVFDATDGIDTVLVGFDEFETMAVELERLREKELYSIAAQRIAQADADGEGSERVSIEDVIGNEKWQALLEEA